MSEDYYVFDGESYTKKGNSSDDFVPGYMKVGDENKKRKLIVLEVVLQVIWQIILKIILMLLNLKRVV